MAGPQDITVTIFGNRYVLRSASEPDLVQGLAEQVDRRMREAAEACGPVSADRLAVLVALNLADDLSRAQKSGGGNGGARERIENLITLLASEVGK